MRIRQGILKTNDLSPDGVRIIVNWDDMVTSSSVFILCVNTQAARGWQTESQVRVEDNKLGVRIWRTV